MTRFAKLLSSKGVKIRHPKLVECDFDWDDKSRRATAFAKSSMKLLAELHNAHVIYIHADKMLIAGVEPRNSGCTRYTYQEWIVTYLGDDTK